MRERVEIFPGHWIEVTPKLKKQAGLRKSARVVATLMGETIEAARDIVRENGNIKYTRLMLDEAARIARKDGMAEAIKATGIKRASIDLRMRQLRRAGKLGRKRKDGIRHTGSRYTLPQKQACVRLAQELMGSRQTVTKSAKIGGRMCVVTRPRWSHRKAFIEAGRRLGMNGRSVEWMWLQGTIPLDQQPSGR